MALGQNPFNPSRTLPTLAAIQQRRRELLAYQARQESAQALATPTEEDTYVPEGVHVTQGQEEQQENDELQEPYAEEGSEPSVVLPPRSSAPPPPALAGAAFHGNAGFLVCTLAPHTEADPAAVLLQFLAAFGNLVGPARTAASVPPVTASTSSSFSSANRARPAKGPAGARSPASSPKPTRSGLRAV
jgi:hypothetical protein